MAAPAGSPGSTPLVAAARGRAPQRSPGPSAPGISALCASVMRRSRVYGRGRRTGRTSELVRPVRAEERGLLGCFPGGLASRPGLPAGEVHVRDGLEDRRDRAVGQVVVDVGGDGRVRRGLGLVDVDVQVARDRVGAVGDGLGGRLDAGAVRLLGDAESLTVSRFSSAKAKPTQPSELGEPAMPSMIALSLALAM